MNDQVIIAVANAITAQAETLKALIEALPRETRKAVAEKVEKVKDTPKAAPVEVQVEQPVVAVAPVVPQVVQAVVQPVQVPVAPVVAPAPVVSQVVEPVVAPATVAAPAPAPAPATAPQTACPITDHKGLLNYTMTRYRTLGPIKGAEIQQVLTGLGYSNINDVKQEHYAAYYAGCEAIQA